LPLPEVTQLLTSSIHEERFLGLLILVRLFEQGDNTARQRIYDL